MSSTAAPARFHAIELGVAPGISLRIAHQAGERLSASLYLAGRAESLAFACAPVTRCRVAGPSDADPEYPRVLHVGSALFKLSTEDIARQVGEFLQRVGQ